MTPADLLAAYLAGRITEETFKKLLELSRESDFCSSVQDSLEDSVEDFFDFFRPF